MVRVADDDAIFEKGRTPFQDRTERALLLLNLKPVDGICATASLPEAILKYKPTHLVKGQDWYGKLPDEVVAACVKAGTLMVFVNTPNRTSTQRLAS